MENKMYELLRKRASHREFKSKKLKENEILKIINAAKTAPTSMDGHNFSIINVINTKSMKKVADWAQQQFIENAGALLLFVTDFTRTAVHKENCEKNATEMYLQPLLASFLNIGLSMMAAIMQAESMGIGSCCIGALRWGEIDNKNVNSLSILKKLFRLPKHTFIACGLILGYKKEVIPPKPKFKNSIDVFTDYYVENTFTKKEMIQHNEELRNYYINVIKKPELAKKSWMEVQTGVLISQAGEYSKSDVIERALVDHLHKQSIFRLYEYK